MTLITLIIQLFKTPTPDLPHEVITGAKQFKWGGGVIQHLFKA